MGEKQKERDVVHTRAEVGVVDVVGVAVVVGVDDVVGVVEVVSDVVSSVLEMTVGMAVVGRLGGVVVVSATVVVSSSTGGGTGVRVGLGGGTLVVGSSVSVTAD